jgi:hypothetical protein
MAKNYEEKTDVISAELYPCSFPEQGGKYIARLKTTQTYDVKDICVSAINRGGVNIRLDDFTGYVNAYLEELAYQIANRKTVLNRYFSITPKVSGLFDSPNSKFDPAKHRLDFTFRRNKGLSGLISKINVAVSGPARSGGHISEVYDSSTEAVNSTISVGEAVRITGHKIKVTGDHADVGLYFVRSEDEGGGRVKFTGKFLDNKAGELSFVAPRLESGRYHIEISTQFAGKSILKEPRVIQGNHEITARAAA